MSLREDDIFAMNILPVETVSPSETITNEINLMADWLLEQDYPKRQKRSIDSPLTTSSSSFSPPITPLQQDSLGFDDVDHILLQPLIQHYLLSKNNPFIHGEKSITILSSKVAQKSYGTEKRFLCPPPATIFKGQDWWTTDKVPDMTIFKSQSNTLLHSPKLTIKISGETVQQSGAVEWQSNQGSVESLGKCVSKQLYISDADEKRKRVHVIANIQLANGLNIGPLQSKGIKVISKPSKKRQSVKNMDLCIHHGTTIALFNRIRSQTVSTKYLGVSSQNDPSTQGTCFVARASSWDPFVIWIVDTSCTPDNVNKPRQNPSNPDYPPSPAIALHSPSPLAVHYNQPVVLQCVTTGLVSPVMIIRKVDKQSWVLGGNSVPISTQPLGGECSDEYLGDPVSQLHKIAFQIVQNPSFQQDNLHSDTQIWRMPHSNDTIMYLACLNDAIGMSKTSSDRKLLPQCNDQRPVQPWTDLKEPLCRMSCNEGRRGSIKSASGFLDSLDGACWTEDVSDAAVWTVVGTDSTTHTFWTPPDRQQSSIPSFPTIHQLSRQGDHLLLTGENFTHDLDLWFGDIKSPHTDYISSDSLHCKIPIINHSPVIQHDDSSKKIPLLLVRSNGVVHKTNLFHTL